MKMRKAIKNIMALGTGLTMLGATVFGAVAADLGTYPDQYIQEGKFDGLMVVGATAKTDDVLGIVDIATSLQFSAKKVVSDSTTTTEISGDNYLFETNADVLVKDEALSSVKTTLTDENLGVLKTTTIRNSEGTTDVDQYLTMSANGLKAIYDINTEDDPELVGDYLKVSDGEEVFEYEIQFEDGLKSEIDSNGKLEDIEDEDLYMLGETFSIVEGENTSEPCETMKLTLMGGAVTDTLKEGETRTYEVDGKEYEVTVVIVADSGVDDVKTKLMINGEVTKALEDGDTDTLDDGTVIGIRDVLANEGAEEGGEDIVSFYIGANKIIVEDGQDIEVDEENIQEVGATISSSEDGSNCVIDSMVFTFTADEDYFVEPNTKFSELLDESEGMLSENWDILYGGLTQPSTTEVELSPSGDDKYELKFVNQEGIEYDMPLAEVDNGIFYRGEKGEQLIYTEATATPIEEDDIFILSKSHTDADVANTHIYEFSDADDSDHEVTIRDISTGSTKTLRYGTGKDADITLDGYNCNQTTSDITSGGESFDVVVCDNTSNVKMFVDLNGDDLDLASDAETKITTNYGAVISFETFADDGEVAATEEVVKLKFDISDDYTDNDAESFYISLKNVSADEELDIDDTNISTDSDEDSDDKKGMTEYGITYFQDEKDDGADTVTLEIPSEQVSYQAYVVGEGAEATTTTGGDVATEVQRIEVGKSVLDSEVTDVAAQNIISVGGPCVNTVSATLLDISSDMPVCYEEFPVEEGEGIIKMVENGENVATIVAGYSAADTRNAAQVLANYQDYAEDLEDKEEVVVSGTQITVPVAEEEEEAPAEDAGNETTEE